MELSADTGVISPLAIDWCHSDIRVKTYNFRWTISKFSSRWEDNGKCLESLTFPTDTGAIIKCLLKLYPKGINSTNRDKVSLFFKLQSGFGFDSLQTKYKLSLLNSRGKFISKEEARSFRVGDTSGFSNFVTQSTLHDEANGLLSNDTLKILCELSILFPKDNISRQPNITLSESKIIEDMKNLFVDAKFTDVTLVVGDHEVQAHKAILAARSPVFAAMFEHKMEEATLNRVVVTDIDVDVLKETLHFIYTDKSPKLAQIAEELLIAADKYDLQRLKGMCEEACIASLTVETAADKLVLADRYSAQQLKTHTMNFINAHKLDVWQTEGWHKATTLQAHLFTKTYHIVETKEDEVNSDLKAAQEE